MSAGRPRVAALSFLMAGLFASLSAFAANSSCFIGVDNATVLVDVAFPTVDRASMPTAVSTAATVKASCGATALLPSVYRWVLTQKILQLTMLSGTTPTSVLSSITKSVKLSATTLEVNDSIISGEAYKTTATITGMLSGLSSQLSGGTYRLTQSIDVQRQSCTWLLLVLVCSNDGARQTFSANYTLTVTEPVTPVQPSPGAGPIQGMPSTPTSPTTSTTRGVTPTPWAQPGAIRKARCEI